MKLAVVLFNLGGPDCPEAVGPFLRNLFSDRAIISLPWFLRWPVAWLIAWRRTPVAKAIYAKIGGCSPILEETQAQARALEMRLGELGVGAKAFVAMRYWKPFSQEAADAVAAWQPDRTVLLPLYPQFSTTTTASSVRAWESAARRAGLAGPVDRVCCYPCDRGFIAAEAGLLARAVGQKKAGLEYRILFSAHGLPKKIVDGGDPYQWQTEATARAIAHAVGVTEVDWILCYQSRVGPLEWIGPATDAEIRRAGGEGKGVIIVPMAFVSEHSETLVELDIEYRHLAESCGVADYIRVPTVGIQPGFIEGLADLVYRIVKHGDRGSRVCPGNLGLCGFAEG
jgi:ferrochelatase